MVFALFFAVIEDNVETAGKSYDYFFLAFECVPESFFSARHIVYPICTCYLEWKNASIFYYR